MTNAQKKRAARFSSTSAKLTGDYKNMNLSGQRRRNAGRLSLGNPKKFDPETITTIRRTLKDGSTRAFMKLPGLTKGAKARYIVRSPPNLLAQKRRMNMYYGYPGMMGAIQKSRLADADKTRRFSGPGYDYADGLYKFESDYMTVSVPDYHAQFNKYIAAAKKATSMKDMYKNLKFAQTFAYFIFPRSNKIHANIRAAIVANGVTKRNAILGRVSAAATQHQKSGAPVQIQVAPAQATQAASDSAHTSAIPENIVPASEVLSTVASHVDKVESAAPDVDVPVSQNPEGNVVVKSEPEDENIKDLMQARAQFLSMIDQRTHEYAEAKTKGNAAEMAKLQGFLDNYATQIGHIDAELAEQPKTGGSMYRRFKNRKFLRMRRHH